jgi:amidase
VIVGIKPPTSEHLRRAAADLGLALGQADIDEFYALTAQTIEALRPLDSMNDYLPPVTYPRSPGSRPSPERDPLHAWYVQTSVRGADEGPLLGKQVVLKDNICLAGVPMMNGASTLEGYVPDVDATVVTRVLEAGGEIVGKAHCEYLCYSGGSHTNATGPTHNPHRRGYSAGGSSSGCAALVGSGEVPMAIGGDQGGSIREPSAFCGAYGLKPTRGLVPYTGIFPVDHTLDHAGPITASATDNALLLEVLAGADGLDPRQMSPQVSRYTEAVGEGTAGLRIGVLTEGFGQPLAVAPVEEAVRRAVERLGAAGAEVTTVSVPMHLEAMSIWAAIAVEGTASTMMSNGVGAGHTGLQVTSLVIAHSAWKSRADMLSEPVKAALLAGHYLQTVYGGRYYAKAQNLARQLRETYDQALRDVDLLVMPTVPFTAPPLPEGHSRADMVSPGFDPIVNTAPFDCTGHPAMSVPCGMHDGMPIGAMFVARHFDEASIFRAAGALEAAGDWRQW